MEDALKAALPGISNAVMIGDRRKYNVRPRRLLIELRPYFSGGSCNSQVCSKRRRKPDGQAGARGTVGGQFFWGWQKAGVLRALQVDPACTTVEQTLKASGGSHPFACTLHPHTYHLPPPNLLEPQVASLPLFRPRFS